MSGKTSREKRKMQSPVENLLVESKIQDERNITQILAENERNLKSMDAFLWAMRRKIAGERIMIINPKTGEITEF